ncbi:MAG TPA: response regulator [Candidatus Saccharimonadales bacterium]|nr:response regulator [Candidatus Saccharimonadales bacterium]
MKILLVEPDATLARIYRLALEHDAHQVRTAATAQEGIQVADAWRPELVILELQLVSHSGIEFLYEFRSYDDWQSIPVIIHSFIPPAEFVASRVLCDELGIADFLYKPRTSLQQLRRRVGQNVLSEAGNTAVIAA